MVSTSALPPPLLHALPRFVCVLCLHATLNGCNTLAAANVQGSAQWFVHLLHGV